MEHEKSTREGNETQKVTVRKPDTPTELTVTDPQLQVQLVKSALTSSITASSRLRRCYGPESALIRNQS